MKPSRLRRLLTVVTVALGLPAAAHAQPLTADRAVAIALRTSTSIVNARANVLGARGDVYSSYSGMLPRVSATASRSGTWLENRSGSEVFGGFATPSSTFDEEDYSTVPGLTGSWTVLSLSSLSSISSARHGLRAARFQEQTTRLDVALAVRRQFYEVVRAFHVSRVNAEALRLSRDDERRVRALFEVGSVSRSDVLRAQVRTAQSELDSLTAVNQITVQRNALARALGVPEAQLGEVDTTLTAAPQSFDEPGLFAAAERNRPDLKAADASLSSARAGVSSARFARLPYLTVSGSGQWSTKTTSTITENDPPAPDTVSSSRSETDALYRATVAVNMDLFDGFLMEGRNAQARAQLLRVQESRDALRRNLAAEVREALLAYREAVESWTVSQRAVESATENLKLTQQKYNVGSSTILDLIDSQVQLQRAKSQEVSARAGVHVAEAGIRRVTGQAE